MGIIPSNISFWWISLDHSLETKQKDWHVDKYICCLYDGLIWDLRAEEHYSVFPAQLCSSGANVLLIAIPALPKHKYDNNLQTAKPVQYTIRLQTLLFCRNSACSGTAGPGCRGRPSPATENPIGAADNLLKIFLISFVTKWIMAFNEIHIWLRPRPASSQLQFLRLKTCV